jgi:hypothetical protein
MSEAKSYEKTNMSHLGMKVSSLITTTYDDETTPNAKEFYLGTATDLLPYAVTLVGTGKRRKLEPTPIPSIIVQNWLLGWYGGDMAKTGIFERAGLDQPSLDDLAKLEPYTEHATSLRKMQGKYVDIMSSPYLSILAAPVDMRAFLTGIVMEKEDAQRLNTSPQVCEYLVKPANLGDVLAYAKKVDEVENVADYMDCISKIN